LQRNALQRDAGQQNLQGATVKSLDEFDAWLGDTQNYVTEKQILNNPGMILRILESAASTNTAMSADEFLQYLRKSDF
jgi:hypothetical protein